MIDRYTKVALTTIALALAIIAIRQLAEPARAAFGDCGAHALNPCFMQLVR